MNEDDIRERFGITHDQVACCVSCHEDIDQGYGAASIEVDGIWCDNVCCRVAFAVRTKQAACDTAKGVEYGPSL